MTSIYRHALTNIKTYGFALLAIACLIPQLARADYINGYQLQNYCLSQNPNDDAICVVYITGAVDAITTMDLIAEKTSGTPKQICLGDETSPDDLKAMTLSWLEAKQDNLDFAATLLILGAVQNSYSCPQ